jgi:hypothetical protein
MSRVVILALVTNATNATECDGEKNKHIKTKLLYGQMFSSLQLENNIWIPFPNFKQYYTVASHVSHFVMYFRHCTLYKTSDKARILVFKKCSRVMKRKFRI